MTEKTRSAFEKALQEGQPVILSGHDGNNHHEMVQSGISTQTMPPADKPVVVRQQNSNEDVRQKTEHNSDHGGVTMNPASNGMLEKNLADFEAHQKETLRLHEQFLQNDAEYSRIFANLTQMQVALLTNKDGAQLEKILPALESFERSMMRFHDHQAETLRVHDHYLKDQAEFSQAYVDLVKQQVGVVPSTRTYIQPSPPVGEPLPPIIEQPLIPPSAREVTAPEFEVLPKVQESPSTPIGVAKATKTEIAPALLKVVSEKTGYPIEMLEPSMDMEADLGIDSIKRVEILGAMQALYPDLPKIEPEALAELRTLGQIIDHLSLSLKDEELPSNLREETNENVSVQNVREERIDQIASVPDADHITTAFLQTVSEKTGYPIEMLELGMDMEADLGINSIKRVEILGAIQVQFPTLPKIEPETLAELRTLGQVTSHLASGLEQPRPF